MTRAYEAVDEKLLAEFFQNTGDRFDGSPYTAALKYVEQHLVPLSVEQTQALSYLATLGPKYKFLIDAVLEYRPLIGGVESILAAIEAITFDRKFQGIQGVMQKGAAK